MLEHNVLAYPNSEKIRPFSEAALSGPKQERTMHKYLRGDAGVGYHSREEQTATKKRPPGDFPGAAPF
jgi:hypothetical protein